MGSKVKVIGRRHRNPTKHVALLDGIDDPGAYTRPFTLTFMAILSPPEDEILEYIRQENNQYGAVTIPGYTGPSLGNVPKK